jgi:hypothetical protein
VGFVVDKVAPSQVFSKYFGFPCQSLFHQLLRNHHRLLSGVVQYANSGRSKNINNKNNKNKINNAVFLLWSEVCKCISAIFNGPVESERKRTEQKVRVLTEEKNYDEISG